MLNHKRKSISLAAALALVISASGAYAQIIVTPDQFTFSSWNNLQYSTVGAYPGDNAQGYPYTLDYSQSPSGLVNVPLNGLAAGWNVYNIYEWVPVVSPQWHAVNIINNGVSYGTSVVPGEPWAGANGTQQQWLADNNGYPAGQWEQLLNTGQSDPTADGGNGVWINGSGAASYLQIHFYGFENSLETFDAFKIQLVPEPSLLALGLLGGFALLTGLRRPKD